MRLTAALALATAATLARAQSVEHDVIYQHANGVAFTMEVFRPAKPNGIAVVSILSGGWFSDYSMVNADAAKPFTDKGITVFQVLHGAQPRFKITDIEQQIARAVRFIRYNAPRFSILPNKIGITGGSAGGHLSLMDASVETAKPDAKDPIDQVSSLPNAIVAFFPPTDMVNFGQPGRMPFKEPKYLIFNGAFPVKTDAPAEELTNVARMLSPIYYVRANYPPTLLIHGDKDDLVPLEQSQVMDAALAKAGVDHKLIVVPGANHGGPGFEVTIPAVLDWFLTKLK